MFYNIPKKQEGFNLFIAPPLFAASYKNLLELPIWFMSTWTFLEKPGSPTGLSEEPSTGVPAVQLEPCMECKMKLFCQ